MSNRGPEQQPPDQSTPVEALVLPLSALERTLVSAVGGKAAQLGELIRFENVIESNATGQ